MKPSLVHRLAGSTEQDPAHVRRKEQVRRAGPALWTRLVIAAVSLLTLDLSAQESPTLAAMQDEMQRSMAELRMKGEAAPYFIAYELVDRTMFDIAGRHGAIVENEPRRSRMLRVEVRVGDYAFDNSRFVVHGVAAGQRLAFEHRHRGCVSHGERVCHDAQSGAVEKW